MWLMLPAGFTRSAGPLRAAVMIALLAGVCSPAVVSAAPRLRCQLGLSGATQIQDFLPVADPYGVKAIDLKGVFRFKAVVVGDERKIDYIKLYAYYQSKRQMVLLHTAHCRAPQIQADPGPDALTGTNYLYSPDLERELQYGCALLEVAP